jgi:uncharacterized membrane protein
LQRLAMVLLVVRRRLGQQLAVLVQRWIVPMFFFLSLLIYIDFVLSRFCVFSSSTPF